MKLIAALGTAISYLCIATVLAAGIGVGALMARGMLDKDRTYRLLGVLHGIEPVRKDKNSFESFQADSPTQASFHQVVENRMARSLNLDMRESAIEKALNDLRALETKLKNERDQFNQRRIAFQKNLENLQNMSLDQMALDQQQTTEVVDPKIAKELLLQKLENEGLDRVVTIVKNMPLDKRKKLSATFKTEAELEKLYLIWDAMGHRSEEENLIRETQKLSQANPVN